MTVREAQELGILPPIPMILFCPACGLMHVDGAEESTGWANPPHRSHRCGGCRHIWRPADVATVGVVEIETAGSADSDAPIFGTTRPAKEERRLRALLNRPEIDSFADGVVREAAHQVDRYGVDHDAGKRPSDWFWLIGFLAGKILYAVMAGDADRAKHHCISTAAVLANWHAFIGGADMPMRPGIAEPVNEMTPEAEASE